jgi:transcriptional regulator with XRE-family HTH domain
MAGPTIRRVQLGTELRRLREAAGMSRPEAAAAIKTSKSRLAAIELGRNVVSFSELVVLLRDHYHGTEEQLATLEEIREEASQRGWWSTYGLPESISGYVGLETDASEVRTVELETVPGLLQTEEYARALYLAADRLSAKEVARRVAARMQRQARLSGDNPLKLTAYISQAALERCANQPSVAAGQLSRLIDRAQWPNITIRVVPFSVGVHAGHSGPFSVLSFAELLPDIAYYEYAVGGHLVDDESVVGQLDRLLGKLGDIALGRDESLEMITELAQRM